MRQRRLGVYTRKRKVRGVEREIEEAIKILNEEREFQNTLADKRVFNAINVAIEALKQEPCEDAISRTDMLDAIGHGTTYTSEELQRIIKGLLPVNPQPKTGHWIKEETIYGWDGKSYQCSVCGRSIHLDTVVEDLENYPYCHCGTKMTNSAEEEKPENPDNKEKESEE